MEKNASGYQAHIAGNIRMLESRFDYYKTGIKEADDEHRQLLLYMDDIQKMCKSARPSIPDITRAMEQLLDSLSAHFKHEEQLMVERNSRHLGPHMVEHIRLSAEMRELTNRVRPSVHVLGLVVKQLEDIFVGHIDTYDRQIN